MDSNKGSNALDFVTSHPPKIALDARLFIAFYFVIISSTLLLSIWVWAFGGALYLAPYVKKSPTYIKIQFVLAVAFLIFMIVMTYLQPAAAWSHQALTLSRPTAMGTLT